VDLTSQQGSSVGALIIPESVAPGGTVSVAFVSDIPDERDLGNIIVDIRIQDSFGLPVTELSEDVTICLEHEGNVDDSTCLGFFNVKTNEWECQDSCLEQQGNRLCGRTDHLTSFALLLEGNGGQSCSSSEDFLYTWLSCGAVVVALIVIITAVALNEFKIQGKTLRKRQTLQEIRILESEGAPVAFTH